jgi:hypothetical protein
MQSHRLLSRVLLRASLAALLTTASTAAGQGCPARAPVAFLNVDVLTMDSDTLLPKRVVLVRDGKIAAISPSSLPSDACRVDGHGQVLMPGLADTHVHTSEREMPLYLANGVTFIREMNGSPALLALRDRIKSGEVLGPRMLVSSTLLAGKPFPQVRYRLITSEADAYVAAHAMKEAGYDYLKIYDGLTAEEYAAFVQASKALNMPLDGHIPADVGLTGVIAAGQHLQHMDKIAFALAGHSMDTTKFADARKLFDGRGAWVTPTLASLRALDKSRSAEYAAALKSPEIAYVDAGTFSWWESLTGSGAYAPSRWYQYESALLRVLRGTNTRFLLGTDDANPLMVAGYAVHEELDALVRDGGFSTWDALRSATKNVGEFLGDSTMGRLAVGARADLILVVSNPLKDLSVLRKASGVMVNGRWLPRSELDSLLSTARVR